MFIGFYHNDHLTLVAMWHLINTNQAQKFLLRELTHHQLAARKFGMQIADPKITISIFSIQYGEEDKVKKKTLQTNHLAYSLFYNEKKIVILTFFHTNNISLHIHQSIVYRGHKKKDGYNRIERNPRG